VFILMKNHIEHCEMVLDVRPVNISAINNYKFLLLSVLHIINVFRCVDKELYQTNFNTTKQGRVTILIN
jgi:hypothetical protein